MGAASSRDGVVVGGRVVYSTKVHSRGIDSVRRGPAFRRGCGGKIGRRSRQRRKVVAPDALCSVDHPASGAGRIWVGAASSRDGVVVGGRVVYSTKVHSRGIDSVRRGPAFRRGCGGKIGRRSCQRRKVVAPDALCSVDHPASGAGRIWVGAASSRDGVVVGGRASTWSRQRMKTVRGR